MRLRILGLAALLVGLDGAAQAPKAPPDTMAILKGVERLYNSTKTLQATFTEKLIDHGRTRSVKKGTVYISRPKKTRWDYSTPAGSWFLSDGDYAYDYDKAKGAVERIRIKETDDMRIPLAFLLGTLDFNKDFYKFESQPEGADTEIVAYPKNNKLLFTKVGMLIAPDSTIRRVRVTGQDLSIVQFELEDEKRNGPVASSLFVFKAPAGAKIVDDANEAN